jgi:hypothetical protein
MVLFAVFLSQLVVCTDRKMMFKWMLKPTKCQAQVLFELFDRKMKKSQDVFFGVNEILLLFGVNARLFLLVLDSAKR